jgi:hypothetical protein
VVVAVAQVDVRYVFGRVQERSGGVKEEGFGPAQLRGRCGLRLCDGVVTCGCRSAHQACRGDGV